MKIGVNTLFLIPSEVGGTQTYLTETLRSIAEAHPENGLVLFTNRENDPYFRGIFDKYSQVEYRKLDFPATNRYSRILREQFQLPGAVRDSEVDVLWSPGYTAPYSSPCPQVVTIPDMQYKSFPQDFPLINLITTDLLVRVAVSRARRIIAISNFSKYDILKHTRANPERIDVTHLAVDQCFGKPVPEGERNSSLKKLGINEKPFVLCVSNTYPHKNIHTLVDAFREASSNIPHNLVLVGKPRMGEPALLAAVARLQDPSRVIRFQYLDIADLVAVFQSASAFILPSLYEGFGLPVLEAMMAGVPVITTRIASIPEIGGDCVTYFNARDSHDLAAHIMNTVNMNKADRAELCSAAAARASAFTWQRTAEGTFKSLQKAAQSAPAL